jgi:EmrB/QacA subfamily drug resistance transporter
VTADHVTTTSATSPSRAPAANWVILLVTCLGQFMVILDASIVNVALPSIRTDLGFGPTDLQWVVNAYTLTFAGFLLIGGRAADLFGRKRMLLIGLSLFTLASLAGGVATGTAWLITARAAQGIGAAILSPATLTIITTTFTDADARAKALGAWSAVAAAGGVVGNILGGVLTGLLNWRWVLFINIPIGVALIVVASVALVGGRDRAAHGIDLGGAVATTLGLAALIYGIVQSDNFGWDSPRTLVPIVAGLVLLALFVFVESRTATPMMPLRLFGSRAVSVGTALMLLVGATSLSMWYVVNLYLQNVLHYDALRAGLAMAPNAVAIFVFARLTSKFLPHFGAKPLIAIGAVVATVGFLWNSRVTVDSSYLADVLGPGLLISAGTGLVFTPIAAAVTSQVQRSEAGIVSGIVNAARQVGGSLGIAVLATVVAATSGFAHGYDKAFLVAAGVSLATALLTLVLPSGVAKQQD